MAPSSLLKLVFLLSMCLYCFSHSAHSEPKCGGEISLSGDQSIDEKAQLVVAKDGTGNFTTITDAINAAPIYSCSRFIIYVKKGVYSEYVEISKNKWNLTVIGDGMDVTVITGNRSVHDRLQTYHTATFAVEGPGFIAQGLTFENTSGPQNDQAVAFRSSSDRLVMHKCAFRGYQDTLYTNGKRQFYKDCFITGTVDFIFGDGTVVFQSCTIIARKSLDGKQNTITAQGRKINGSSSGFSLQFCNFSVADDVPNSFATYLGRPWQLYSRTVVMQSYISGGIRPEGWRPWNESSFALDTLYYAEYDNHGPGAGSAATRVKWRGYHFLNDSNVAEPFTVSRLIEGDSWLPATGVSYIPGLNR